MQFTATTRHFKEALTITSTILDPRPIFPALKNLLIEAKKELEEIYITSYNLNCRLTIKIPGNVESSGTVTTPGKLLSSLINKISNEKITFNNTDHFLQIQSDSGKLNLIASEEFVDYDYHNSNGNIFTIKGDSFYKGVQRVSFAVSGDETKRVLTGINIRFAQETIKFYATDGRKLCFYIEDGENGNFEYTEENFKNIDITVTGNSLKILQKLISIYSTDTISFDIGERSIKVETENFIFTERLLEGPYPDCDRLIPKDFNYKFVTNRLNVIKSTELANIISNAKDLNLIECKIAEDTLDIFAEDRELGKIHQQIEGKLVTGESLSFNLSGKYLLEGLKAMESEEIQINIVDKVKPIIINPLGENTTFLIMPIDASKR